MTAAPDAAAQSGALAREGLTLAEACAFHQ